MTTTDLQKGIGQWPATERPRERLLAKGPEVLTDAQLLAILLRTGRRDSSAVQVAMELLHCAGGLAGLAAGVAVMRRGNPEHGELSMS